MPVLQTLNTSLKFIQLIWNLRRFLVTFWRVLLEQCVPQEQSQLHTKSCIKKGMTIFMFLWSNFQSYLLSLSGELLICERRITLQYVNSTSIKRIKNLIIYLSQAFLSLKDSCLLLIRIEESDDVQKLWISFWCIIASEGSQPLKLKRRLTAFDMHTSGQNCFSSSGMYPLTCHKSRMSYDTWIIVVG